MEVVGDPSTSNTLTYEFTDVVVEQGGVLEIRAIMMSRQGAENYRKVALSDIRTLTIDPDDLFSPEVPNLKPEGEVISSSAFRSCTATSYLTDSTIQGQDAFGQVAYIPWITLEAITTPIIYPK